MSEVTTKERVTFEVVTQQNHIKELLDLPVASETPGLDALMNVPQHERERQTRGEFENEIGITPQDIFHHGRHAATCVPSRRLSLDEYARIADISPRIVNASPTQFRG